MDAHPPRRTRLRFCLIFATAICGCAIGGGRYLADPAVASQTQAPQTIISAQPLTTSTQWPEYDDQSNPGDYSDTVGSESYQDQSYRSSSWDGWDGSTAPSTDEGYVERPVVTSRGDTRSTLPHTAPSGNAAPGARVVDVAKQYLGFNYAWGGASPRTGFDCSGFTWYVFQEAGIAIPSHNLAGQLAAGPRLTRDQLQPGDLVFFVNTYAPGLTHGGIYVGSGNFIHAENESTGVRISPLDTGPWADNFLAGSRPR